MIITKTFEFDSAHKLIGYKGKCEKLHGHTYQLHVSLEGEPKGDGMIIDFHEIEAIVKTKVLDILDHAFLNDTIPQPTAENIAIWIFNQLKDAFTNSKLAEIKIFETKDSFVTYRG